MRPHDGKEARSRGAGRGLASRGLASWAPLAAGPGSPHPQRLPSPEPAKGNRAVCLGGFFSAGGLPSRAPARFLVEIKALCSCGSLEEEGVQVGGRGGDR